LFAPLTLIPSLICVYSQRFKYPRRSRSPLAAAVPHPERGTEHTDADDPAQIRFPPSPG